EQAIDAIVADGRRFSFLGRSMVRNSVIARDLGLLSFPEELLVDTGELSKLPADETAVVCTGSQGEPYAALSLMAAASHRTITLVPGDTVVISATPIPGNETKVSRVINNLLRLGVDVQHGRNASVHVSGHAAQDELRMFLNVVRPEAFVPVHGEYRHLSAHAGIARSMGVPDVVVCEDGDRIVLHNGALTVERGVISAGYVYLDGSGLGDVGDVLRDRRHLADDGVLIVTLGVEVSSGDIVFGPDVDSHGVTDDAGALHRDVASDVAQEVAQSDLPLNADNVRARIRSVARRRVRETLDRRPVVFPVLIEV
ncbi:MAG: ribonuclease J, partial [Acidimicrobiia bacterium]